MKIIFVNIRKDLYPPLGVCYLSSYLKRSMPDTKIQLVELEFGVDKKDAVRKILNSDPDIVGFTTYTVGYHEVTYLCEQLKRICPDILVWFGGPHITSLPQTLSPHADLGILGEGEETFIEICRKWFLNGHLPRQALSGIKGICYKENDQIVTTPRRELITPLDLIPPPDLSLLDMKWYTGLKRFFVMERKLRGFVLLSSRGCSYDCRFCQSAIQWGQCRYHSAERVVSEIEALRARHSHINAINIIDDLFIGNRKRLREIVRLIKEKNLQDGIVFNINGRANLMNDEVLELLKSINVIQISYGFESASERILNFLKRGTVNISQNHKAALLTNSYGIGVGGQFMIGTLGETEVDVKETLSFINLHKMSHAHLSVTTPLPGTELWEICKQKGLVSEDMDWRKLDFGNPTNPELLYVNSDFISQEKFSLLLKEVQKACDKWNPAPILRLRDYPIFMRILSFKKFVYRATKRIISLPGLIMSHVRTKKRGINS